MTDRLNPRPVLARAAAVPLLPGAAISAATSCGATKPDPAVAAYQRWLDAYDARQEHTEAQIAAGIDLDDDDPEWLRPYGRRRCGNGGAGAGRAHHAGRCRRKGSPTLGPDRLRRLYDWRDPETFTTWNYTDGRDARCTRSLLAGLREMGGMA